MYQNVSLMVHGPISPVASSMNPAKRSKFLDFALESLGTVQMTGQEVFVNLIV